MKLSRSAPLTFLMAVSGLTGPAYASDWSTVWTASNGVTYAIDRESIRKSGNTVRVWVRSDYSMKTPSVAEAAAEARERELAAKGLLSCGGVVSPLCQPGQTKPAFVKELLVFDCAKQRLAVAVSIEYRADGSVIKSLDSSDHAPEMTMVIPDTVGETLFGSVCR